MKYLLLLFCFTVQQSCIGQTAFSNSLKDLSSEIAHRLARVGKKRIAVIDLTDIAKAQTNAGKYMSEVISINLSNDTANFMMFERQNLDKIMSEIKLSSEGYVDEASIKRLGKFTGADVIISGNYTVLSKSISVTIKIFETETAYSIGGAMKDIPIDNDACALLGVNCAGNNPNLSNGTGSRGFNSPVQSGENYNNPTTVDKDCATKITGDACFENRMGIRVKIGVYEGTTAGWGANHFVGYISVNPGQTACFYELPCKVHHFVATKDVQDFYQPENHISEGNIMIEKCKSKTNTIY